MTPQRLAGQASGVTRRAQAAQRKNEFIRAVTLGASLTHNGVVSRHTYQKWRKADADFNTWLDGHIRRCREASQERRAIRRKEYDAKRQDYKRQWYEANRDRVLRQNNASRRAARIERVKFYQKSALDGLYDLDVFSRANSMVGRHIPQDVRESAISELVLMMLEGHEPDLKQALRVARGETMTGNVTYSEDIHGNRDYYGW